MTLVSGAAWAQSSQPTVTFSDSSVVEGDSGTTMNFVVSLSATSNSNVTVSYATADGMAMASSDYTAASGTLTFTPGQTSQQVSVAVSGDAIDEEDEWFSLYATSVSGAQIGDTVAQGTIIDDDAPPTLTISDATVTEGNSGSVQGTLTVTLSAPSGKTISVGFATADGTATFNTGDFNNHSGSIAFSPGVMTRTVPFTVNGDTVDENTEVYFVNLSSPSNATLADSQGSVTIVDDDTTGGGGGGGTPTISISDVTIGEGDSGLTPATLVITLSQASSQPVTVDYTTSDSSATFNGSDYQSRSGTLVFNAGETTKNLELNVVGDAVDEPNEIFHLNLSNASNATIAVAQGDVTIFDDDGAGGGPLPAISIADASAAEGDSGRTPMTFDVSLSRSSTEYITVEIETEDGTARFTDSDYTDTSGGILFAPGETSKPVPVNVRGDTEFEDDETLFVSLSAPTNATIADDRATGTIVNDDRFRRAPSRLTLSTVAGTDTVNVRGTLAPPDPSRSVTVRLLKWNGSRYVVLRKKVAALGRAVSVGGTRVSRYSTRFARPSEGICRIKVTYGGNSQVKGTSIKQTFSC